MKRMLNLTMLAMALLLVLSIFIVVVRNTKVKRNIERSTSEVQLYLPTAEHVTLMA